jgi:NRPS condensation-like uncharacterized protein
MLVDHRPAYPMNILVRLRFSGGLDHVHLEKALSLAIGQHPMFTMTVQPRRRHWYWTPGHRAIHVQWLPDEPADDFPALAPLDVNTDPGLRVLACEDATRADLIFQAHHATCDGLGLLGFIETLLIHYARIHPDLPNPPAPAPDLAGLRMRHRFGLTRSQFFRAIMKQGAAWRSLFHYLRRDARPLLALAPAGDTAPPSGCYPRIRSPRLNRNQTGSLLAHARHAGVTLNDILIHALFLTLQCYQDLPENEPCPWLRMCIPVNLRPVGTEGLTAVNLVSHTFLNRRTRDVSADASFLKGIHKEMQAIRRGQQGLALPLGITFGHALPGGLKKICYSRRCQATAVLTNPGRVFQKSPLCNKQHQIVLGNTILESLDFVAPVRPKTNITVAAFTYADQLNFTLHYDPHIVSESLAQILCDDFIQRLLCRIG